MTTAFGWWWMHAGGALSDAGLLTERTPRGWHCTNGDLQAYALEANVEAFAFTEGQQRTNPLAEKARRWIAEQAAEREARDVEWFDVDRLELLRIAREADSDGERDGSGEGAGEG